MNPDTMVDAAEVQDPSAVRPGAVLVREDGLPVRVALGMRLSHANTSRVRAGLCARDKSGRMAIVADFRLEMN